MCCLGECTGGGSYTRWHQLNSSKTQLLLLLLLTSNLLSCRCPRRDLNRQHAQAASPPTNGRKNQKKEKGEQSSTQQTIGLLSWNPFTFWSTDWWRKSTIPILWLVIISAFNLTQRPALDAGLVIFTSFFAITITAPVLFYWERKKRDLITGRVILLSPSGYISFTHDVVQSAYRFVRLPPVCPSHLRVEIDSLVFFQFISATPSKTNKLIRWIYKNCICLPLVWFVSWCRVLSAIGDLLSPSLCVMRSPPTHISLFD